MSHRSSQRRNLAAPESKTCPSHYSDPIQEPYKPSFLVKQLSSLTLTYDKHPPPFDTPSHPKPTTTSSILHSSKSNAHNTVKKTPRENPQKPCLELERKRLQGSVKSDPKGVADDVKVENPRVGKRCDIERVAVSLAQSGGRRRSFCGSQVNLGDIFAINGVKMVSADMPPFMQIHAVDSARKAFDSMEKFTSKTLALSLKKEFDGVYGPAWHCIVGTSFGSFVTHSVGGFIYFSLDQKLYVLLFKTAVQRAS